MPDDLLRRIATEKIIAIVRGVKPAAIARAARALLAGGVTLLEVTFDHSAPEGIEETLESLRILRREFADEIAFGAGTVLTPEEAAAAHGAGARYIVSPNTDAAVIAKTKSLGMLSLPGAFTPTEIVAAHGLGADIVKIFPAGLGGPEYLRALRGPLPHIPLAAVGGVDAETIPAFLAAGVCCFGVGGNLVNGGKVAGGDFASVTESAKSFRAALEFSYAEL